MTIDDWVKKAEKIGKLLTKFPESWPIEKQVEARRKAMERLTEVKLKSLMTGLEVIKAANGKNIEQAVGVTTVPLGIAGPLLIKDGYGKLRKYFLPLATTEGVLVASVNRGCKAIAAAGGADVRSKDMGMTRGPVFKAANLDKAKKFEHWLANNFSALKNICERTSSHLELLEVSSQVVGRNIFVRFKYDTQEAMGMNMATIATQAAVQFIEARELATCVSLSGNYCVDKKPAYINEINGKGKRVWAEVLLKEKYVKGYLKTDAEKLAEVFYRKMLVGSAASGSMGFNGHFANIVAALFLATGQDIAHVAEGSLGISTAEREKGGIIVSCYLPNLVLGTVGGGTGLPAQKEALRLLGFGQGISGEACTFAEVVGGAVLAAEISLAASLAEGSLAKAHLQLARGGKR
jgi:hydroxymethylglutaryl-CoA reductase (NADPH)